MIRPLLQQTNLTSILLIAALIAALIIAFKLMEMIFDTMLVAGISAAFYLGLRTIQGGPTSFNDLLLFTFLGSTLYMTYSLLASLYKVGATVIPIPIHIIQAALKPVEHIWSKLEQLAKNTDDYAPQQTNSQKNNEKENKETEDKKDKTTKEVILGSKKPKKDKDEE